MVEKEKTLCVEILSKSVDGAPKGKTRWRCIGHILMRENGSWIRKIALLRDRSIWHPA